MASDSVPATIEIAERIDTYIEHIVDPDVDNSISPLLLPNQAPIIIHFFGSAQNEFYNGVSLHYMRDTYENIVLRKESPTLSTHIHVLVHCHPDGTWTFPGSLGDMELDAARRVALGTAIGVITALKPVAAAPYMFCGHGMTTLRGLFEMLGIPIIGNNADVMALTANKWKTRCVLQAAGVPVPKGELLVANESDKSSQMPKMDAPFIIKPCSEDNSLGLSLYKSGSKEELMAMIDGALKYDKEVIVEEFIPLGYEVRVAVIENEDGALEVLPLCNYMLQDEQPIRMLKDKLQTDQNGVPTTLTKCTREIPPTNIPADVITNVGKYAMMAHKAIGCRDYSLFDVRVAPDGRPYFLEASPYCSFSTSSVVVMMSVIEGRKPYDLFGVALQNAIRRGKQLEKSKQS